MLLGDEVFSSILMGLQTSYLCRGRSRIFGRGSNLQRGFLLLIFVNFACYYRVATVRENSLETEIFSRSGKSQGISIFVREI